MPPSLNLYLKHDLEFSVRIEPYPNPFDLIVRGWKTGQYITLDNPVISRFEQTHVPIGKKCRIRYVSEGMAISFSSRVLATFKTPLDMLLIEYPKALNTQISLKKFRPTKTAISTSITIEGLQIKGIIWDISIGGLQFSTNKELSLEQTVGFDFEFFTGQKFTGVRTKVRNKRVELRCMEFPYLYGCEFIDLQQNEKQHIHSFLEFCFKQWEGIRAKEMAKTRKKTSGKKGDTFF